MSLLKHNHFISIAISNFISKNKGWDYQIFYEWVLTVRNKQADAILVREFDWNEKEKFQALNIIHAEGLYPILHNPTFENSHGLYHWNSLFLSKKPKYKGIHGISCHTIEEVKQAEAIGYDYVFLSPIYSTQTHLNTKPLGIDYLKKCISECKIPIIALGGITTSMQIQEVKNAGAKGFASIRYFDFS